MKLKLSLAITFIIALLALIFTNKEVDNIIPTSDSKESTLKAINTELPKIRAVERWNALIKKDWKKAYSYETPSYRKAYSENDFSGSFGQAVKWVSIKHKTSNKVSDNIIDVKLELIYIYDMDGNEMKIPSIINERWQLINNNWWHVKQ